MRRLRFIVFHSTKYQSTPGMYVNQAAVGKWTVALQGFNNLSQLFFGLT
jgi:hypothetical protein